MVHSDHYHTLEVSPTASQTEIKQSYRRLVKLFHPDRNQTALSHERITQLNAAYEVLGDPKSRRSYDEQRQYRERVEAAGFSVGQSATRQQRAAAAQARYRTQQRASQHSDEHLELWLKQVYAPVNRLIQQIEKPLTAQINQLAADPFDDELMEDFQSYLDDCRDRLAYAERIFRSMPNPANVAGVAVNLYYCLSQIGDGLEQLEYFTHNYDDSYLHTGQELFRIARGLRREAQAAAREMA